MRAYRHTTILALIASGLISCGGGGDAGKGAGSPVAETMFIETGYLQAVSSTAIVMPWFDWSYGEPQITLLEEEGTLVEPGDVVAELDQSGVLSALETSREQLELAEVNLSSLEMTQATQIANLNADLQQRLSRYRQAQIDTQRVAYESESKKNMQLLELENARIALEKSRRKIETTKLVQEQDRKIQLARIEQIRSAIETAERTLESYTLKAPARGMVVYSEIRADGERRKIQVGDNIRPGSPVIQLPDMSRMKVETAVNETDISKIQPGQKVRVRLDAYPKKKFDGVITMVANTCHPRSRGSDIKVFDVEVLVDGNDRVLKPGMTVSCEFLSITEPITASP